jgi:O-antigen/teichoic acid export membrane protein
MRSTGRFMPLDLNTPLSPEIQPASSPPRLHSLARLFSGRAAREGYLAAIDQAIISLSNFLATVLLARNATPTELGVYGVGFIALRLVRSVQEGLVIQPMNVLGPEMAPASFRRYATSTSLIQTSLALAAAVAVAAGGRFLTITGNDVAGPALFSLWFAFLTWQLQEYLRRMLYTRGAVFQAVVNTFLANAIRLGLMFVWARQGQLTGISSLNAIAWGSLAALLPGLWFTRDYWTYPFDNIWETWQKNWDFGRWLMGSTLANWVSVEFYPVLTAGLISFAATGIYRALQNLVAPIHMLLRATDTFLTPRAAKIYHDDGIPALSRTLRLTYLIVGIPTLGILGIAMLFPEQLLRLIYGESYVPYSSGMVLMALFYALWFAYWPLQTALKAARSSRPIFISNLAAILCMFSVGIWMILRWGVYGTIAGQALNALVVAVILWYAWLRVSHKQGSV